MKFKKLHNIALLCCLVFLFNRCVEPFEVETRGFEGVLVVDAKLTDELKQQQILLSRARPFEIDSVSVERNASVRIIDDLENQYNFTEVSPGKYESAIQFAAAANRSYRLEINTTDNFSFTSEAVLMPGSNDIKKTTVERMTQADGDEGIGIMIDTESIENLNAFLRYEYEEDYKIIAPFWNPAEFDIIADQLCVPPGLVVEIKQNTKNNKVCYGHTESTKILLADSEQQASNNLTGFEVRFISRNNFALSHRYSILVRQFSLDQAAYSYYERLASFSESEDVFTAVQPGFLDGNISANDSGARVLGYFEVASVSEKRLFFNYTDFFENEDLPPYPVNCAPVQNPPLVPAGAHCTGDGISDGTQGSPLIDGIRAGLYVYHADNELTPEIIEANGGRIGGLGPYFTKFKPCGDCTELGSNIKPDFWVE